MLMLIKLTLNPVFWGIVTQKQQNYYPWSWQKATAAVDSYHLTFSLFFPAAVTMQNSDIRIYFPHVNSKVDEFAFGGRLAETVDLCKPSHG